MISIEALAADYDGTLARDGEVSETTAAALARLKQSGRKLLLVTGRQPEHLVQIFPDLGLFDVIVAENGALLRWPGGREQALGPPPPDGLVAALRRRGVTPLDVGRAIIATARTNEAVVRTAIAETGAAWRTIFNRDSLMCLPAGVDKGTGLAAALDQLAIPARSVLGVGDAENDLPFLVRCGAYAVVENALPELKGRGAILAHGEDGDGVAWLIDRLLDGTLQQNIRPAPAQAG
jgi:hydroxymethylpyrimidine pyrophosphatase-like HAD family hydrolase